MGEILTPKLLFKEYSNKKISKADLESSIIFLIENTEDYKIREQCIDLIEKVGLKSREIFRILENCVISDKQEKVRQMAIKVLFQFFPTKCIEPLNWIIERDNSFVMLSTIFNLVELSHNPLYQQLKQNLIKKFAKKYDIVPEEAILLLKIEYECNLIDRSTNMKIDFKWFVRNEHIYSLSLLYLDSRDLQRIQPFLIKFMHLEGLFLGEICGKEITGLGQLINLKGLTINKSDISDISNILELEKLANLENLWIKYTHIAEIKGLETLKNLQVLVLEGNQITDIKGLDKLYNLKELYLGGNPITEIKGLDNLKNLRKLYFYPATDASTSEACFVSEIKGLDYLINLEELSLKCNVIPEIKGLDKLINLKNLNLSNNKIKEIAGLTNLTALEYLDLSWNEITKIQGLEGLMNLKDVCLDFNKIIDKKGLEIFNRPYFIDSCFKFPRINFRKKRRKAKKGNLL